jgi:hypothetical protein
MKPFLQKGNPVWPGRGLWWIFLVVPALASAQRQTVAEFEFFAGANVTRPLGFSPMPTTYQIDNPLTPGIGWQAGALVSLPMRNTGIFFKTGLMGIFRQYSRNAVFAGGSSTASPPGTMPDLMFSDRNARFFDVEVPLFFSYPLRVSDKLQLAPTLGVIPGWRIREQLNFRRDEFFVDGTATTQITEHQTVDVNYNHCGPFNRFSLYGGMQFRYTYESGRTLTVEPHVRVNVLPLFDNGRPNSAAEREALSIGVNLGFLAGTRR